MANYSEMTSKELRTLCKENGIAYNITKNGAKHTMTKDEMVNALYDWEDKNSSDEEIISVEQDEVEDENIEEIEAQKQVEDNVCRIEVSENTSIDDLLKVREEIDAIIKDKARAARSAVEVISGKKHVHRDAINEQYDENWSMYGGVNPYTFIHTRNKERYIEEAEVGTLIAFLDENGKPRTAALVNRSSERRRVKLETEYNWEFVVSYDNILWVKRGDKWAYNVFRILKGYNPNGKCGDKDSE